MPSPLKPVYVNSTDFLIEYVPWLYRSGKLVSILPVPASRTIHPYPKIYWNSFRGSESNEWLVVTRPSRFIPSIAKVSGYAANKLNVFIKCLWFSGFSSFFIIPARDSCLPFSTCSGWQIWRTHSHLACQWNNHVSEGLSVFHYFVCPSLAYPEIFAIYGGIKWQLVHFVIYISRDY